MTWTELTDQKQLDQLREISLTQPVLIFKHSTRCSTSRLMLDRLERNWDINDAAELKPFFIDVISRREVSKAVAELFDVEHESPQVLIIQNGRTSGDFSHYEIDYGRILDAVRN